MNLSSTLTLILLAICTYRPLHAQEVSTYEREMKRWEAEEKNHLRLLLDMHFNQRRMRQPGISIPEALLLKYPEFSLNEFRRSSNSSSEQVQLEANAFAARIGLANPVADPIRKMAVRQLVEACVDPHGRVWQSAARRLLDFDAQDFSSEAWKILGDGVVRGDVRDDVLLVVGVAEVIVLDKWLKQISPDHFNAVLALARFGDDDAARKAVAYVDGIQNMNLRIYSFLKRLGYTRHPIALEYIATYLDKDDGEITLKESGDYYRPPIKQAALEAITRNFADCPLYKHRSKSVRRYDDTEYQAVRQWVEKTLAARRH